jgi:hypothetical protein
MCRRDARISAGAFTIPAASVDGALSAAATFLEDVGWEGGLPDLGVVFRLFNVVAAGAADRSISGLEFEGTLLEELEELFACLAPHVQAGSFLVWEGDRGNRWRYDFDGQQLVTTPE